MKTIFISSFFGLSARNILSTSILDILAGTPDTRIVIIAPKEKQEDYQRSFGGGRANVVVEGVELKNARVKSIKLETAATSRLERLFFSIALNACDTAARRVIRIEERHNKKRYVQTFFHWALAKLSNFGIFRRVVRYWDLRLLSKNRFTELFDAYRPDLIFSTDIYNEHDVQLMKEARWRGLRVAGMVRSWDNVTSHGMNRVVPDVMIVNTPKIKEEAVRYCDMPSERVFVAGIPHYDRYVGELRTPREQFFKEMNLDPKKKTVFFAPPSDIYTSNNPVSVEIIKKLLELKDVQLIIRLYVVGEVNLGDLKPIPGRLAIDAPRQRLHFVAADLAPKEDAHLADLLYYSDVVAVFASTLAIDAAVFGKPIVFVGFDSPPKPYWESLRRYYDFDHQRYLLDTGGAKVADSMESFISYTKEYLAHPEKDIEGRKKITDLFCWKLDGKSGERAGKFLAGQLHRSR